MYLPLCDWLWLYDWVSMTIWLGVYCILCSWLSSFAECSVKDCCPECHSVKCDRVSLGAGALGGQRGTAIMWAAPLWTHTGSQPQWAEWVSKDRTEIIKLQYPWRQPKPDTCRDLEACRTQYTHLAFCLGAFRFQWCSARRFYPASIHWLWSTCLSSSESLTSCQLPFYTENLVSLYSVPKYLPRYINHPGDDVVQTLMEGWWRWWNQSRQGLQVLQQKLLRCIVIFIIIIIIIIIIIKCISALQTWFDSCVFRLCRSN